MISRDNHPTLALDAAATSVLIGASVIAFVLLARTAPFDGRPTSAAQTLIAALTICALCGLAAAATITGIYNVMDGPDPRRFSFATNVKLDTIVVAVGVLLVTTSKGSPAVKRRLPPSLKPWFSRRDGAYHKTFIRDNSVKRRHLPHAKGRAVAIVACQANA